MFTLDIRTALICFSLIGFVSVGMMAFVWLQGRRHNDGLFQWFISSVLIFVAVFCLNLKGEVSEWLSIFLAHGFIFTGILLSYEGSRLFTGNESSGVINWLLVGFFLAIHGYFTFINPDYRIRVLNTSVFCLLISFQVGLFFYQNRATIRGPSSLFIAFSFFASATFLIRFVTMLMQPATIGATEANLSQTLFIMIYQSLWLVFIFLHILFFQSYLQESLREELDCREQDHLEVVESQQQMQLAIKGGDLGTWDWDVETSKVKYNERWASMLGYKLSEIEPTLSAWERLVHPEDLPKAHEILDRHLSGEVDSYSALFRMKHKEGGWVWILDQGKVFDRKDDGRALRVCGTHLDITALKRAEQALQDVESRFVDAFSFNPAGIFITDKEGSFINVNDAFCEIVECDCKNIVGKNISVLNFCNPLEVGNLIERLDKEGERVRNYETTIKSKKGTIKSILLSIMTIEFESKYHRLYTAIDITSLKRAQHEKDEIQAQLSHSAKLATVGTLSAGVAHELNNPLTAVISFSQMIERKANNVDYVKDRIKDIHSSAIRMKEIIDHLRRFTRESSYSGWQRLNLKESLDASFFLLNQKLRNGDVFISINIEDDLPLIMGDQNEVESIFHNLIINSMDSFEEVVDNREKGIRVDIKKDSEEIKVIYKDNAMGMTDESKERIFDPFFTTKEVGKGTGLGMSMVHGIMENLGGSIFVESSLGKGSKFELTFLVDRVDNNRDHNDESDKNKELYSIDVEEKMSTRGNVLIIDDEDIICGVLKEVLSAASLDITVLSDSDLAYEEIENKGYDLIITDYSMPNVSGLEIVKFSKKLQPDTPILVMSGYDEKDERISEIIENGASGLISKPFSEPKQLIGLVESHIRKAS